MMAADSPTGQVRVLQAVPYNPQPPVHPVPAEQALTPSPPTSTRTNRADRLKRKVMMISTCIAVYIIFDRLIMFRFNIAFFQASLEKISKVMHFHEDGANKWHGKLLSMVVHEMFGVVFGMGMALILPFCGYMGAKRGRSWMAACFCGCNALQGCFGLMAVLLLGLSVTLLEGGAPTIEHYLEKCDATKCKSSSDAEYVDCLAASMWNDYKPQFKHEETLPRECPPIFLKCGSDPAYLEDNPAAPPTFLEAQRRERHLADIPVALPTFLEAQRGEYHLTDTPAAPPIFLDALRAARARKAAQKRFVQDLDLGMPKPADPIKECKLEQKNVELFHDANILFPVLLPDLIKLLLLRLLIAIPSIFLACLGFGVGCKHWRSLQQSDQNPRPSVAVAGQAPAAQRADMEQPLMAVPVPSPANQQPAMLQTAVQQAPGQYTAPPAFAPSSSNIPSAPAREPQAAQQDMLTVAVGMEDNARALDLQGRADEALHQYTNALRIFDHICNFDERMQNVRVKEVVDGRVNAMKRRVEELQSS